MNSFKAFFDLAKTVHKGVSTVWSSTYHTYKPFHVQYCKIELRQNPIGLMWVGAVAAEYTTPEGKKETYYDYFGYSSTEVLEKLEEHIKEWLGEDVYGAGEENRAGLVR